MIEAALARLHREMPGFRAFLSTISPDPALRARVERMAGACYYFTGDRHSDNYLALDQFATLLAQLESEQSGKIEQLLHFYQEAFTYVTQGVVGELAGAGGEYQIFILQILGSPGAASAFVECSKSFLLATALKRAPHHVDGTTLVNELIVLYRNELSNFKFLLRLQFDRIQQSVKGTRGVVAFFCPDKAFRKNCGQLPELLTAQGYGVLYFYGMVANDEFESHATSFYVGMGLILKIDFVDLYFTGTILDVLPDTTKKALIIHGSFAPFSPEAHEAITEEAGEADFPILVQYQRALAARTHFSAFFRLYDYYIVSSAHFRQEMHAFGAELGMTRCGQDAAGKTSHRHFDVLNKVLRGRQLPRHTYIVPAGYSQIDVNSRVAAQYAGELKTITYAPTPLNGKPAWNQYASLYNSGIEIVGALLDAFPEFEIVFKPHISDRNAQTMAVIDTYSARPGFIVDWSGSNYMALYAKTAVLVSDFSSTAYTFALSTLRPVLFNSPRERVMPDALLNEAYCRNRTEVGLIALTAEEVVTGVRTLLKDRVQYEEKIRRFRDQNIFHVGHTESYLCDMVANMISGDAPPDWDCLNNAQ